jgi:outer membrane protein assembly factor BamB
MRRRISWWKLPLPAYSGSTPIIWGDRIFLNVATAANSGTLELWAIDRSTKSVAWKRPIAGGNHSERKQNMSSPSPVTDGTHVWIMTGVGVLKSFDFAGKELWSRVIQADYGRFASTGATHRLPCCTTARCTCRCCTA